MKKQSYFLQCFSFKRVSFILLLFSLFTYSSFALQLSHQIENNDSKKQIRVSFLLDPEGESVNAYEGQIVYDIEKLELDAVETDNSIVTTWITYPKKDNSIIGDDTISFEGITQGGFSGVLEPGEDKKRGGKLFSLLFSVKEAGDADVSLSDVKVYKDDGEGSLAKTPDTAVTLSLPESYLKSFYYIAPPENHETGEVGADSIFAELTQNTDIYDGKTFIVFENIDKQKSLERFEISESKEENPSTIPAFSWTEAKNPYLLTKGDVSEYVHVKALYTDGSYAYKTLHTVENGETDNSLSYILSVSLLSILFLLYVFSFIKKKKE